MSATNLIIATPICQRESKILPPNHAVIVRRCKSAQRFLTGDIQDICNFLIVSAIAQGFPDDWKLPVRTS